MSEEVGCGAAASGVLGVARLRSLLCSPPPGEDRGGGTVCGRRDGVWQAGRIMENDIRQAGQCMASGTTYCRLD
eukprot:362644-Chlamydomonas_euryale.AAC.3